MRRATLWVVLGAVVIALMGCEPQYNFRPATQAPSPAPPPPLPTTMAPAGLQCYWQINVALEDGESLTRLVWWTKCCMA